MNTKIIVALVVGIALIGLTGAVSAWVYPSYNVASYNVASYSMPTYDSIPGTMTINYNIDYNGDTVSGTLTDNVQPIHIEQDGYIGNLEFHIIGYSQLNLASSYPYSVYSQYP